MILEDATFEVYGYWPCDLIQDSSRPIITVSEFCNEFGVVCRFKYQEFDDSCHSFLRKYQKVGMLGKHHTKETKAKMSAALKGKLLSKETKELMSKNHADFKGEKHPRFGKHLTEEHKKNIGTANKGEKSSNWRGGISFEPYCIKFNELYKREIRKLFNNKCFLCNMTREENGQALSVHHVNYNKNCGCDNTKCVCVPLCVHCHMKTNFNRGYWERKIRSMLD